jgi:hypothetical protein
MKAIRASSSINTIRDKTGPECQNIERDGRGNEVKIHKEARLAFI